MALKEWKLNKKDNNAVSSASLFNLSGIIVDTLNSRGIITENQITDFFGEENELSDPFMLVDMDKAVERINTAIESGERIAVYGDYDCDGVTSTAVLYTYLLSAGADVLYYIPEREMGYGLNFSSIDSLKEQDVSLIITVDNGISALKECEYINELGMEIVITDHHQIGEKLPFAYAVVNPHREDCGCEFKQLCGAGVTLKLIAALEGGDYFTAMDYFADIVAIGTVADVVPLEGENRTIVKNGLRLLSVTENIGLNALIEVSGLAGKKITSDSIAFMLAPRLNAAGRMGSANLAMELLLSEDEEQAQNIAIEINKLNQARQAEELKILDEINDYILNSPDVINDRVIVLAGEGWHHGVIGIVSARITEKYGKPSVILSIDGDSATGSARSVGDFSLYKALSSVSEILDKFGGHSQAAGLRLKSDNIDEFRKKINTYAKEEFDEMPHTEFIIDSKISAEDLTLENVEQLEMFAPFGEKNKQPLFLLEKVNIDAVYPLSENKHLRIKFSQGNNSFYALLFGMGTDSFIYNINDIVDILITLEVNEYDSKKSVSAKLKDIRPTGINQDRYFSAKHTFEKILRAENVDTRLYNRLTPTREEIALVYKYLNSRKNKLISADGIYLALYKTNINFGKILSIIKILHDVELINATTVFSLISIVNNPTKKDLESSQFLHYLKSR